jgi:hypothetical protein
MKFFAMKIKLIVFFFQFILIPVIIIPFLTLKSGSYFGFFGIAFYVVGFMIARFRQWIFLPIPIFFCLWYWYTYGFGTRDYVTIYFVCMSAGILIEHAFNEYKNYVNKILPEEKMNIEYNAKLEEMNARLAAYKKSNPTEKITQEIIEQIRTEIFFG